MTLPWRWRAAPWIAIAAGLALTALATAITVGGERGRERKHYEGLALNTREQIQRRLDTFVAVLRGTAGVLSTFRSVQAVDYRRYITTLDLPSQYPGIRGIGINYRVAAADLSAFIDEQRQQTRGFSVWPAGARDEYWVNVFIEPDDQFNRPAIGFDMASEAARRDAMVAARDSGLPCVTRRVKLISYVGDAQRPGFLIFAPMYTTAQVPPAVWERRSRLRGFSFAAFRSDELFLGILAAPAALKFQVYDADGDALISVDPGPGEEIVSLPLEVAGSKWRVRFVSPVDRGALVRAAVAPVGAGLLATLLLFLLLRQRSAALARSQDAAERVAVSERRYRQLFADLPLPTWVYDRETLSFLDVNDAAIAHYGWTREEFLGMTLRDIRPPEEIPSMLASVASAEPAMQPERFHHLRKDGSVITVEVTGHQFDLDGRSARLVVAHDITEAERIDAEKQRMEKNIARFSESGLVGVTFANLATGTFSEANDAFLKMIGYSRDDLKAGRIGWHSLTAPQWRDGNAAIREQLTKTGYAGPLEKEYLRKDGSAVHVMVVIALIDPGNTMAFILDVSERERAEKLQRENEQILEASRLKSEFLANMSHELRTPLNAIIGFTQMMADGELGAVSDIQKESMEDVLLSSRHLLQLINDVLDLAKVESGKLEFHPREVRLEELVAEVVSTLGAPLADKRLRVDVQVDAALGTVSADEVRLKQVLYNYLSNSIKFSPPEADIAVRARPEGDGAFRLEVEDHGIGIQDDDLGKLFVTFQQLDSGSAKKHPGTGLGLALTRRLVEAQGGSVGVKSTFGSGSVFHVVLPRKAEGAWRAKQS
ncbi:MAG TPA: CHASE domain-containing protein [Myxococcales bacterium]|nr:CHASE domain-containing protein [Myxococcales bacterium]